MSDVEVIVLDIDGGAMLRDCIDSIKKQSVAPRDMIVFDNGSRTPVQLAGVRIIRSETNVGFAAGVNAAYRQTTAGYVALVNNDVILDRDWLATVKKALDRDVRIGAAQTVIRRDEQIVDDVIDFRRAREVEVFVVGDRLIDEPFILLLLRGLQNEARIRGRVLGLKLAH